MKNLFISVGILVAVLFGVLGPQVAQATEPAPTVKTILERGHLLACGHNGSYKGFAEVNDKGEWTGLDIDLNRALATMILGSPDKMQIVPLSWAQRWPALQSGDIDIIIKVTEWTMSRDTELNLQYAVPYFMAGFQILAKSDLGIKSVSELDGASLCIEAGTSQVRHVSNYLGGLGVKFKLLAYDKQEEAQAAYNANRCDAFVGWGPNLAVFKADAVGGHKGNIILPEMINLGGEAAACRQGDDRFVDTVNWMFQLLWSAEHYGITSTNVDKMRANPPNPTVAKMLGVDPGLGDRLGLPNDWGYKVIKHVGNYAEIYDRNVGKDSAYKLPRGVNHLYKNGGIIFPLTID